MANKMPIAKVPLSQQQQQELLKHQKTSEQSKSITQSFLSIDGTRSQGGLSQSRVVPASCAPTIALSSLYVKSG